MPTAMVDDESLRVLVLFWFLAVTAMTMIGWRRRRTGELRNTAGRQCSVLEVPASHAEAPRTDMYLHRCLPSFVLVWRTLDMYRYLPQHAGHVARWSDRPGAAWALQCPACRLPSCQPRGYRQLGTCTATLRLLNQLNINITCNSQVYAVKYLKVTRKLV